MFYFILRFIFICFVAYLVGIESGWYTSAAITLLAIGNDMHGYMIKINDRFYRGKIKHAHDHIDSNWYYVIRDLKRALNLNKKLEDRVEHLELIVQPIKGDSHDN